CSISTSPATSGSILTASTFFWPSILTDTMPPPAVPSTRICATSCCMRSCICCACFIICCMFPGSFTCLLLEIPYRSDLSAEDFLEALHFRVVERARRRFIFALRRFRLRHCVRADARRAGARRDFDLHRTADDFPYRLVDVVRLHRQQERFGRGE